MDKLSLETLMNELAKEENCDNITSVGIIEFMNKKETLEKHREEFNIFYSNYDKKWIADIRKEGSAKKRVKRVNKNDLIDIVFDYFKQDYSFEAIYKKWIESKARESINNAYKLQWVWNTYYQNTDFVKKDIRQISIGDIRLFVETTCSSNSLTETKAKEMKSLLNMVMDFAVEFEYIETNKSRSLTTLTNHKDYLTPKKKKSVAEETFSDEEETILLKTAFERFRELNNTMYLGIILNAFLGLRAGELIALKFSDFDFENMKLVICRSEKEKHFVNEDGKISRDGYEIVDHLKCNATSRTIPITSDVMKIIHMIKAQNIKMGFPQSEWLFIDDNNERKHALAVNKALKRTCDYAGIPRRSNHKIRKTFISELFKSMNFGLTEIRDIAGHKDGAFTLEVYGKTTATDKELADKMANTFSNKGMSSALDANINALSYAI